MSSVELRFDSSGTVVSNIARRRCPIIQEVAMQRHTVAGCAIWEVRILTGIVRYLKKELDKGDMVCYYGDSLERNKLS